MSNNPDTNSRDAAQKQEAESKNGNSGYDQPVSLVLLTLFVFLFSQVVIALVLAIIMLATGQEEDFFERVLQTNRNNFLLVAGITVLQFIAIWFIMRRLIKRSFSSIGLVKPVATDIVRAAVGWAIYMAAVIFSLTLLGVFDVAIDTQQEQQLDFEPTTNALERILVFMSLVAAPAFIEEVLMRGFLFINLRRRLSFAMSTLVVSVLFGVAHLQFGSGEPLLWVAFVDTFVMSVVLCGLTEKYKSLWPAIFAHAIKNSLAFYLLFVREG